MSWQTECGNEFHAGWCRHRATGVVYALTNTTPHPIPLLTKKNILLAIRQMATYTGDIQAARRKIIERAKEIDATYLIPGDWNEDGTLK